MAVSKKSIFQSLLALLAGVVFALTPGCLGNDGSSQSLSASFNHDNVVLKDYLGQELALGSSSPYSPRQTCGECHDFEQAEHGYHFQQGRADENGNVIAKDDFFADGRDFIKTNGMYGKW